LSPEDDGAKEINADSKDVDGDAEADVDIDGDEPSLASKT
jgi:hypothetical protein